MTKKKSITPQTPVKQMGEPAVAGNHTDTGDSSGRIEEGKALQVSRFGKINRRHGFRGAGGARFEATTITFYRITGITRSRDRPREPPSGRSGRLPRPRPRWKDAPEGENSRVRRTFKRGLSSPTAAASVCPTGRPAAATPAIPQLSKLMGIFSKPRLRSPTAGRHAGRPVDQVPRLRGMVHTLELKQNHHVCLHCSHHFLIDSRERIDMLADPESFEETETGMVSANPLGFAGYRRRPPPSAKRPASTTPSFPAGSRSGPARDDRGDGFQVLRRVHGLGGRRKNHPRHRNRHRRKARRDHRLRLVRRPHAGRHALADADGQNLRRARPLAEARLPYISVLTHPTTGGVTASSPPSATSTSPNPSA